MLVAGQAMAFEAPAAGENSAGSGAAAGAAAQASGKHHPGGFRAARLGRLLRSMHLSDEQRTAIRTSIQQVSQENRAKLNGARPSADVRSQIHDLRTQLRAARESGDTTKVTELRGQLDPLMAPMRAARQQARQQVHDAIAAQLTPEQITSFEAKWSQGAATWMRHRARMVGLKSLNLSNEQKSQIQQIRQEFRTSMQNAGAGVDRKAAWTGMREKIRAVLTDEQRAQLDAMRAAKG